MLEGYHHCNLSKDYGDWRINNKEYSLNLIFLKNYLKNKKLVKFKDIGWKGKNLKIKLDQERYDAADINYPCILTQGQNPYNCKYRMIDGRHRITKMNDLGMKESIFYVIDFNQYIMLLKKIFSS